VKQRAILRVILAAGLVALVILGLVQYMGLPWLKRGLTPSQIEWLRKAFHAHPVWVLAGIIAVVGILSLPVLLAGLWAARGGSQYRKI
jgi:hypothetical protein